MISMEIIYCKNCTDRDEIDYMPLRCLDGEHQFSEDPRVFSCENSRILEIEKVIPCTHS